MTGAEPTAPSEPVREVPDDGPELPSPRDPAEDPEAVTTSPPTGRVTPTRTNTPTTPTATAVPTGRVVSTPPTGSTALGGTHLVGSGLAWLVRSVTHVPGVLHLRNGRLRFVSTRGVLFDATPRDLALTSTRGRGGFRITVDGERLRLHVVRFPGAVEVADWLRDHEAGHELISLGEPGAGAMWRDLIAAQSPPPRPGPVELRLRGWRSARARRACAAPVP